MRECEYVLFVMMFFVSRDSTLRTRSMDVTFAHFFSLASPLLERTVIYPWRACFPYGPSNLERTVEEEPGPVLWEHTRLNTCVSLPAAGRKSL